MSNTPSSKLFNIIKSLSGSEKRYFKIFVQNKGGKDNKYRRLFEAIDAQDVFDEQALQVKIYGEQQIETRKYSELKSYLYDLILKSLQAYDEKSSVDYKLKGMLLSVRVLFKRSHFSDCKKLLAKAQKVAVKYEDFSAQLELLKWEKDIAYAQTDIGYLDSQLERINAAEERAWQQLRNVRAYRNLFLRILVEMRKDTVRSYNAKEVFNEFIQQPLLRAIEEAKSHRAQVLYYRCYSLYYYAIADLKQFYETSINLIQLIENQEDNLSEDVSEYISAISNAIISCGALGEYKEVEFLLDKLKKIHPITLDDQVKIHRQYYQHTFAHVIRVGEFDRGLKVLELHLKEKQKFDNKVFESSSFYFQYFYIYFGNGDYEQALNYLNSWLNLPKSIERQELQSIARMLNLIVHFEMGNTLLLDALLRSTYRYLNKRNSLNDFEKRVLKFVKNSINAKSKRELQQVFTMLKNDFEDLLQSPVAGRMLRLFDFTAWLDSKITGEPFAEKIKARLKLS